ncbi:MAG: thioredoxin [Phycisphaerae bacterium]
MAGANILELTEATFDQEVLNCDKPVLVDFWADWCMPCKALAPTMDELANEYAGRVKVTKVDTDAHRNLAVRYNITAIPTIILFQDGQIKKKFVGLTTKKDFKAALDQALG